jgi:hypothetical protein
MEYGIRGWDINGKPINISKIYKSSATDDLATRPLPFDIDDYLLIRRDLKEWFFYAKSTTNGGNPVPAYGRISYVQYRFMPVSINVGYEYGSIETFEYGRSSVGAAGNTDNGVPQPMTDTRRP